MPQFKALDTKTARAYQNGAPDAFGNTPERAISTGTGNYCRHCLQHIPEGNEMLILAHKPFETTQPYAEIGPIFLCANRCLSGTGAEDPAILKTSPDYLIKGYSEQDRIIYGTGAITPTEEIQNKVREIFAREDVAYIHVRSARNNCYQLRIDRDT